jgi:hypothetical protein
MITLHAIRRIVAISMSTALLLTVVGVTPAAAHGCTPGYWKNHTDSWPAPYTPSTQLDSVFAFPGSLADLSDDTLLQALQYPGGPGLTGGAKILLRASVSALLNSAALGGDFWQDDPADVVALVNPALASGDRDTMLALGAQFDFFNNLGCPLS